jgi:hypothetical protein
MRDYSLKKLLICLGLICGSSALMQVMVFNKRRNLHYQHYQTQAAQTAQTESASARMEGTVAAVGSDRIHIRQAGQGLTPVRCDRPERFAVGQKVQVEYRPGNPASAINIETLP